MRALPWLLIAACGGGNTGTVDAGFLDRLDFRGSCAYALAPDGAVVLPETAAQAQTSYRAIDVINVGDRTLPGSESMRWQLEGADAADFTVAHEPSLRDNEACTTHYMGGVDFPVGSFCRLDITFHPTTVGMKQATVHVTQSGTSIDQTFSLRATAVAAPARLYASTPDLYLRPPSLLDSQSLQLVNGGTTDVTLGDPVVTSGFSVSSAGPGGNCPPVLTPGGSCYVGAIGIGARSAGCPMGMFTTTTSAIVVPLTARYVP